MMAKRINWEPLAPNLLSIDTWTPQNGQGVSEFEYIDIASVDRASKSITATARTAAEDAPSRARQIVKANDVLVSTVRPNLNAVALVPGTLHDAIASTGFCVLRCHRKRLNPRYLYYWVRTNYFVADMVRKATGASYPAVTDGIVKQSTIPLPALSEQKRIADILDKVDAIRRKRQEMLEEMSTYPHSSFRDMFGHPDHNPKGWPVKSFEEIADSRLGKMLDAKQQTGKHLRPYMRNLNVQWGALDLSEIFAMDFDVGDRKEFRLQYGDVLICEGGAGVGQTAIWRNELSECYFQKSLHRVRPYEDVATPEFIAYLMWNLMKGSTLLRSISSATIPHLTGVKLKKVRVPVPPIDLQWEFQKHMLKYNAADKRFRVAAEECTCLFNSLVQRAFKGAL